MNKYILPLSMICAVAATGALAEEAPLRFITTDQLSARAKGASSSWSFTIVDARTRVEYGEGHVPGSLSCPASEAALLLPKLIKDKGHELIFYCNGPKCTKSQKAARTALALGYRNVLEYNEGLPAWGKARLPIDGTPLPDFDAPAVAPEALAAMRVSRDPPLVVDVRDAVEYQAFHLPGSINVPVDTLPERVKDLPRNRRLLIACHAGHQSPIAARLLHSLGRSDLMRLDGGVLAWQQKGFPTDSGAVARH